MEVWRGLEERAEDVLTRLFHTILDSEKRKRSELAQIFKNKGEAQSGNSYRAIKFISHAIKIEERVAEAMLRQEVMISEQQYGFLEIDYYRRDYCFETAD